MLVYQRGRVYGRIYNGYKATHYQYLWGLAVNHLLSAPLQQFYQQWRAVINDSHPEVDGIWTGLRLVGGIPTHLKNMTSSVGMMTFPI